MLSAEDELFTRNLILWNFTVHIWKKFDSNVFKFGNYAKISLTLPIMTNCYNMVLLDLIWNNSHERNIENVPG